MRLVDTRRAVAGLQAAETELLAAAVDLIVARTRELRASGRARSDTDLATREICAELGAAMRVSDRSVHARLGDAVALVGSLPAVLEAWRAGRVDAGHVAAIVDAGSAIADPVRRARFADLALEAAQTETPGRLRPLVRDLAARIDPELVNERQRVALGSRQVRVVPLDDGMARLLADLPATLAYAILDRLTAMAHVVRDGAEAGDGCPGDDAGGGDEGEATVVTGPVASTGEARSVAEAPAAADVRGTGDVRGAGDVPSVWRVSRAAATAGDARTTDEVRADVFADLLLAGAPAGHGHGDALAAVAGRVQVTIPVTTLAGADDRAARLAGYGPVTPATARALAGAAPGWDRVLVRADTGLPVAVDRYRPSARLRQYLAVRDERCRFPGCRQPIWRCDVDHTVAAADGGARAAATSPTCAVGTTP